MTRSTTDAPDGQVLAGRYEIGAVLGRGGMAEVRAGWDLRLGRAVAIKTLLPALAEEPDVRRRFEGEARAAARLAHPNAVAVFDVGEEHGVPFLVMEQVVGPTLEEELRRGPLDAGRLLRLGEELLAALGAAHSAGLVHRDVKPANILMAPDGSAKVADFGIAKALADDETAIHQLNLTTMGHTPGTLAYMAPERLAGQPATVQSDLYSVGVVLSGCCPGLDPVLAAVVDRAMARKPEDRFASAAEMSAALRAGARPSAGGTDAPTVMAAAAPTAATSVVPVQPASLGQGGWRRVAGHLGRRGIVALVTVAVLAVTLIAVAVGRDNAKTPPAGTPAVTTSVTTAVTAPPSTLPPTSTITATTRTDGGKGKGKGKE